MDNKPPHPVIEGFMCILIFIYLLVSLLVSLSVLGLFIALKWIGDKMFGIEQKTNA